MASATAGPAPPEREPFPLLGVRALGVDDFGPAVDIDETIPPYGGFHHLTTDAAPTDAAGILPFASATTGWPIEAVWPTTSQVQSRCADRDRLQGGVLTLDQTEQSA